MNELETYFRNNDAKLINKWMHYFDVYDRHFNRFKGKEIVVLEVGVFQGGSLQMWKNYFGDRAKIYGIDINPHCKELEEENVEIFIGSQSDRKFLRQVKESIPPIDILIDDGGHTMIQQIVTFEELFDHVKDDGVYLCEDLHTSYQVFYGGGHKRNGTFIEYSKNFIDYINAYHSEQRGLKVNGFTRSVSSLHYYDSILVVEKHRRDTPPVHMKTGAATVKDFNAAPTGFDGLKWKIKKPALTMINKLLRFFRIGGFMWR
ncbi:MAG: class I SAM-dependent methyltransferase [Sphingobacterium sp.]|jgi:23S rRNA U2552 (ribose-2'-O)-methylase RlmE/FtsJ|uniref:class I SAM-dependent methyltransferase n=1 Tax=unclassified Sphingobacterium TaxID=2609468 RepID=UPI00283AEB37|nr:class I SAM-dependent methyltransferase [Sphingobacterium sp.]MDR3006929.1 class I SAM-dependent methyltransferase [Sphingobacterium sp.]